MRRLPNIQSFNLNSSTVNVILLILITLVVTTKDINRGDFRFSDASAHAMNGVFLHDILKKMPLLDFYQFTLEYYAKYPRLTIPYHPPFFNVVEAIFFTIFGISTVTARLSVVFFSLLSVVFLYSLINSMYNKKIAFFSSGFLITTPTVVIWSRQVMLEMPALAMIILSAYFLHTAVDLEKKRHLLYCALCIGLSMWTKQTTVFMVPLFFSYILVRKKHGILLKKEGILSCIILLVFAIPLTILTLKFANFAVAQVIKDSTQLQNLPKSLPFHNISKSSSKNMLYYIQQLPNVITIPLLVLSCVSFIGMMLKGNQKSGLLFLLWIFWGYALISYVSVKSVRYAYFWIPPFCVFASLFYYSNKLMIKNLNIAAVILSVLLLYQFATAYGLKTPTISGFEKAAKFITDSPKGNSVLLISYYSGNFIFHIRKNDKSGNFRVLREEKVLPNPYRFKRINNNVYEIIEKDLYQVLENYGTKYIIVEEGILNKYQKYKILIRILNNGNFTLKRKYNIDSNMSRWKDADILIYEYKKDVSLKKNSLELNLLRKGLKIIVPIKPMSDNN